MFNTGTTGDSLRAFTELSVAVRRFCRSMFAWELDEMLRNADPEVLQEAREIAVDRHFRSELERVRRRLNGVP